MDIFNACYEELKRLYGLKQGQTRQERDSSGKVTPRRSEERGGLISRDEIAKKIGFDVPRPTYPSPSPKQYRRAKAWLLNRNPKDVMRFCLSRNAEFTRGIFALYEPSFLNIRFPLFFSFYKSPIIKASMKMLNLMPKMGGFC